MQFFKQKLFFYRKKFETEFWNFAVGDVDCGWNSDSIIGDGNDDGLYFVSDDDPVVLWKWINTFLNRMGFSKVKRKISYGNAMRLGALLEGIYGFLKLKSEPPMTRFLASQLATSHYFDISKAKKDFDYQPLVSQEEGINRLIYSLKSHSPGY